MKLANETIKTGLVAGAVALGSGLVVGTAMYFGNKKKKKVLSDIKEKMEDAVEDIAEDVKETSEDVVEDIKETVEEIKEEVKEESK